MLEWLAYGIGGLIAYKWYQGYQAQAAANAQANAPLISASATAAIPAVPLTGIGAPAGVAPFTATGLPGSAPMTLDSSYTLLAGSIVTSPGSLPAALAVDSTLTELFPGATFSAEGGVYTVQADHSASRIL